jgi:anti-anti-sigma factor
MDCPESLGTLAARDRQATVGRDTNRNVVWLVGEYDISTEIALWQTLEDAMAFDAGDLVVDLSEVQFFDAATIGVFVRARCDLHGRGQILTLRSPTAFRRRVLDLCGLSEILEPAA